jgi:hypothetical protein
MECAGFGAAGFVVKLPKGANTIFAAEIARQPTHPDQFPTAIMPTTIP